MKNLYFLNRSIRVSIYVIIIGCPGILTAQSYYPAGLGNSTLKLWLTASDPTTLLTAAGTQATNGSSVATWKDKSGAAANAIQATTAAQPVYKTNQQNGFGAVLFQNTGQYMTGPSGDWRTIVATRAMFGTGYQYLFSSPALQDFSVRFTGGASTVSYTDGPNSNDWCYNTGSPSAQWINGTQSLTGPTTTHILVDQAAANTIGTYSLSSTFLTRGMYNDDPIYELIVYVNVLNTTTRKLLENYQAAEWGLYNYLPTPNYPVFIPPTPTTWNRNLVGIGLTSSTDAFTNDAAGSTDGLGFFSGTGATDFLGSPGFVMGAHNGQAQTTLSNPTLNNVPVNSFVWNRSWYVQHYSGNSSGAVTLNFMFPDYDGTTPNAGYHFGILYSATDGTFTSGTNAQIPYIAYTVSASSVSFRVNASNLPTGYYTIIWNLMNVLPITLESFTVTKTSAASALAKWTVGSGFGPGSFAVQRSADGAQYSTIGTVEADASNNSYSYADNTPLSGPNYYRLLLTDAQGNTTYSAIDVLSFNGPSQPITVYPVPASDVLHINAPGVSGGGDLLIFSASGQLVATYRLSSFDGARVSVANLPVGSYFAKINTPGQSVVIPFMKRNP